MRHKGFRFIFVFALLSLSGIVLAQNNIPFLNFVTTAHAENNQPTDSGFFSSLFSFNRDTTADTAGGTPTPTPLPRVNVALASNGGVATASSQNAVPPSEPALANDGVRNWATTRSWKDDTQNVFPDTLQIAFNNSYIVNEVNLYFVKDDYNNPTDPDASTVTTLYGVTAFDVQYWDGANWVTVPNGMITGNNKAFVKVEFPAVRTDRMRVVINATQDGFSRVVEMEVYQGGTLATPTPTPSPTPTPRVNVALATNGGIVSVSSQFPSVINVPTLINDGVRNWAQGGSWKDNTPDVYPDTAQIDFNGNYTINEIDLYLIRDDYTNPTDADTSTPGTIYGLTAFDVQYWNGANWVTVPNGAITNNNKALVKLTFAPVTTTKIRVVVNLAQSNYSRIVELEAYTPGGSVANEETDPNSSILSQAATAPKYLYDLLVGAFS